MTEAFFSWENFNSMPLVGIMRNIPSIHTEDILKTFYLSGLTTIELTINSPGFEESLHLALSLFEGKLNIGAGTICTTTELQRALQAGAQFIVTPITDEEIIKICKKKNIPVFPGAYTPTEIYTAWKHGADMVKVFPASAQAMEYIRAIKGPFPDIRLLPTGGVHLGNCIDFLKAGADGLGIGSSLFNTVIMNKGHNKLKEHCSAFAERIRKHLSDFKP
jgi:2-dehydro-3-deoxyphosphogluconate aldolase/(4S)-4-hydroxy-2-oxoglutarate aldolase